MRKIAMVLVVMVTLAIMGFFLWPKDIDDRTSGWGVYENTNYNLRFRYPAGWILKDDQGILMLASPEGDAEETQLRIELKANPQALSAVDWLKVGLSDDREVLAIDENQNRAAMYGAVNNQWAFSRQNELWLFSSTSTAWQAEFDDLLRTITKVSGDQVDPERVSGELLQLQPKAMQAVFDGIVLAETQAATENPAITGDVAVDEYLRTKAVARGYLPRPEPTGQLTQVDGYELSAAAATDWQALRAAALAAGHDIALTSGYRSVAEQQAVFNGRLTIAANNAIGRSYTNQEILAGEADEVIDAVLKTAAPPGYSKHHTGYAIDVWHVGFGGLEQFGDTPGYDWLAADNFANAKRHGFVPSYPDGLENQGPNPEPWEFVWVGRDVLRAYE